MKAATHKPGETTWELPSLQAQPKLWQRKWPVTYTAALDDHGVGTGNTCKLRHSSIVKPELKSTASFSFRSVVLSACFCIFPSWEMGTCLTVTANHPLHRALQKIQQIYTCKVFLRWKKFFGFCLFLSEQMHYKRPRCTAQLILTRSWPAVSQIRNLWSSFPQGTVLVMKDALKRRVGGSHLWLKEGSSINSLHEWH